MKNFNMLLFWVAFFFFVVFFASNAISQPMIFFLGPPSLGSSGIIYVAIVGMLMGWGLSGMFNGKGGGKDDDNFGDGEGF